MNINDYGDTSNKLDDIHNMKNKSSKLTLEQRIAWDLYYDSCSCEEDEKYLQWEREARLQRLRENGELSDDF